MWLGSLDQDPIKEPVSLCQEVADVRDLAVSHQDTNRHISCDSQDEDWRVLNNSVNAAVLAFTTFGDHCQEAVGDGGLGLDAWAVGSDNEPGIRWTQTNDHHNVGAKSPLAFALGVCNQQLQSPMSIWRLRLKI